MPAIKNPKADLRANYGIYIKISFIFSIAMMIAAFKFSPKNSKTSETKIQPQDTIHVEITANTVQRNKPPELPKPPKIIEASLDETPDDVILPNTDLDIDADVSPVGDRPNLHKVDETDEKFYLVPDQLPEPIGGLKSIWEKIHYTEIAKIAGITGTVIIEAAIDKEGNVINATVVRGIGGGLDEISLEAVHQTKFKPGKQRGRPVNVKMTIPIKFVLQ
ncbi:energy transducer TonB [bacterium BMS3Abin03]|nr:energy transducer TonB [bacterium BMS3Abin03]